MNAKSRFLKLAHVILGRLKKPRLNAWWLDVCDLTAGFENQRRGLLLPYWLESFDYSLDLMMTTEEANQVRSGLVRFWKPGEKFDPDCFRICGFGGDRIGFAFCDPFQGMSFVGYETDFLGFANKTCVIETLDARPFDQTEVQLENIRLDAIFCIDAWICYVESPTPVEVPFTKPAFTREQLAAALERMDGTLPIPTSIKDAEFILWHKGHRPRSSPVLRVIRQTTLVRKVIRWGK